MDTGSPLYPWTLQDDGSYTRPLGHSEQLFKHLALAGGANQIACIASAVIKTPYDEQKLIERLKAAWISMYCRYPHVASTETDLVFTFRPFKTWQEVYAWVDETLFINRTVEDPVDLLNSPGNETPITRPQLHYLIKTKEIVLKSQHVTFDARGGASFVGQIAELINDPGNDSSPIGLDCSRLVPALQDALGHQTAVTDAHIMEADILVKDYCDQFPSIGPAIRKTEMSSNARRAFHTFSKKQTEAIVTATRECGATIAAIVHTALVKTLKEDPNNQSLDSGANFSSFSFVDARSLIKDKWLSKYPFTPYVSAFPLFHKAELTTKETIKVASDYFAALKRTYKSADANNMASMYPISDRILKPWMQDNPPNANIVPVSSYGVLDEHLSKRYGEVEVENFSITMNINDPAVVLGFYTWQSCLTINVSYNEKFYSPEYSQGIAKGIAENIVQVLDEARA